MCHPIRADLLAVLAAMLLTAAGCKTDGAIAAEVTIPVEGMDCGKCADKLAKGLRGMEGVRSALVSFEKKQAVVAYDSKKVTPDKLAAKVREVGYQPGTPLGTPAKP